MSSLAITILRIPPPTAIAHIPVTSKVSTTSRQQSASNKEVANTLTFGAGLPIVPSKLVKKIQDGEFIYIADLN